MSNFLLRSNNFISKDTRDKQEEERQKRLRDHDNQARYDSKPKKSSKNPFMKAIKTVSRETMDTMDAWGNQVQSVPAALFTKGKIEDGQYTTQRNLIGNPLANIQSHIKAQRKAGLIDENANPVLEGFATARRAGKAFNEDPNISSGTKFATGVGFDPTTYTPFGLSKIPAIGRVLKAGEVIGGPAAQTGVKAGALRLGIKAADELVKGFDNPATAAKFIAGGAVGTELASRYNLPFVPESVEQLAGGALGGGIGSSIRRKKFKKPTVAGVTEVITGEERVHHGTPKYIPAGAIMTSPTGDVKKGFYVSKDTDMAATYTEGDPINASGYGKRAQKKMRAKAATEGGQQMYRFRPVRDLFFLHHNLPIDQIEASKINNVLQERGLTHRVKKGQTGGEVWESLRDNIGANGRGNTPNKEGVLGAAGFDGMTNGSQFTVWRPNEVLESDLTPPGPAGPKMANVQIEPEGRIPNPVSKGQLTDAQDKVVSRLIKEDWDANNRKSTKDIDDIQDYVRENYSATGKELSTAKDWSLWLAEDENRLDDLIRHRTIPEPYTAMNMPVTPAPKPVVGGALNLTSKQSKAASQLAKNLKMDIDLANSTVKGMPPSDIDTLAQQWDAKWDPEGDVEWDYGEAQALADNEKVKAQQKQLAQVKAQPTGGAFGTAPDSPISQVVNELSNLTDAQANEFSEWSKATGNTVVPGGYVGLLKEWKKQNGIPLYSEVEPLGKILHNPFEMEPYKKALWEGMYDPEVHGEFLNNEIDKLVASIKNMSLDEAKAKVTELGLEVPEYGIEGKQPAGTTVPQMSLDDSAQLDNIWQGLSGPDKDAILASYPGGTFEDTAFLKHVNDWLDKKGVEGKEFQPLEDYLKAKGTLDKTETLASYMADDYGVAEPFTNQFLTDNYQAYMDDKLGFGNLVEDIIKEWKALPEFEKTKFSAPDKFQIFAADYLNQDLEHIFDSMDPDVVDDAWKQFDALDDKSKNAFIAAYEGNPYGEFDEWMVNAKGIGTLPNGAEFEFDANNDAFTFKDDPNYTHDVTYDKYANEYSWWDEDAEDFVNAPTLEGIAQKIHDAVYGDTAKLDTEPTLFEQGMAKPVTQTPHEYEPKPHQKEALKEVGYLKNAGGSALDVYQYEMMPETLKDLKKALEYGNMEWKLTAVGLSQLDKIDELLGNQSYKSGTGGPIGGALKGSQPKPNLAKAIQPVDPDEIAGINKPKDMTVDEFIDFTKKELGPENKFGDAKDYAAPGQEGSPIAGAPKGKGDVQPVKNKATGEWEAKAGYQTFSDEDLGDLLIRLKEAGYNPIAPEGMASSVAKSYKFGDQPKPNYRGLFKEMRETSKGVPEAANPPGPLTIEGEPLKRVPKPKPEPREANPLVTPRDVKIGLSKGEKMANSAAKVKKYIIDHGVENQEVATPTANEYLRINNIMKTHAVNLGKMAHRVEHMLGIKDIREADLSNLTPEQKQAYDALRGMELDFQDTLKQFGVKRFKSVSKFFDEVVKEEGGEKKTYSDIMTEYGNAIANKVSDAWLAKEINKMSGAIKLSDEAGVPIPTTTVNLPGVQKVQLPKNVGQVLSDAVTKVHPRKDSQWSELYTTVNNTLRSVWATADASFQMIQMLPTWFDNPKAAFEATMAGFHSMKDPTFMAEFIRQHDTLVRGTEDPSVREMIKSGGHLGSSLGEGSDIQGLTGKLQRTPVVGQFLERSNTLFSETGNANRILLWDTLWKQYKSGGSSMLTGLYTKAGKAVTDSSTRTEVLEAIASAGNRATGYSSKGFGGPYGSAIFFAPRFMQSQIEMLIKAVSDGGIEGQVARRQLIKLAAIGTGITVAANYARGEDTEFDPRSSNFLRIKNVGGADLSIFGPWDSLIRGIVKSAPQISNDGDIEMGDPTYLLRTKLGPVPSVLWDLAAGKNVVGQKAGFEMPTDFDAAKQDLKYTRNLLMPFSFRKIGEEPITSTAFGLLGGKGTPLSNNEILDNKLADAGIKKSDPDYLIKRKDYLVAHPNALPSGEEGAFKRSQEIQKNIQARRKMNDDLASSNQISLTEFRDNRKIILTEQRNKLEEVIKSDIKKAGSKQKEWVNSYVELFDSESVKNEVTGEINPEEFDKAVLKWEKDHGSEAMDFIDRYTGAGLNPVEKAYHDDLRTLEKAGYFDLPKYTGMKSNLSEKDIDELGAAVDAARSGNPKLQDEPWATTAKRLLKDSLSNQEMLDVTKSRMSSHENPDRDALKKKYGKELLWFNPRANWDSHQNYKPGTASVGGALKRKQSFK